MTPRVRARARARVETTTQVLLLALAAGAPAVVATLGLLAYRHAAPKVAWTLGGFVVACWLAVAFAARRRVAATLQTLAGVLTAYREGDFSVRARSEGARGAFGELVAELNALGDALRDQRLDALEAWTLLRKVMAEIDVAVFAFDAAGVVRLANATGERLAGRAATRLVGRTAAEAGLDELLGGTVPRVVTATFPGGSGPWELRRGSFRLTGLPHTLVVLADLSGVLRAQERDAWQRLVRVLGHEINNSLAPIRSISENLRRGLEQPARADDWDADAARGLGVIARRAESLARFMTAYARLARLPPPRPGPVDVGAWVRRVVALESRVPIEVVAGPAVTLQADGDQLDQLLINLVRNAADAALETRGGVRVVWTARQGWLELGVEDEGAGIADATSLFVPFFTTKPEGSGIGLALSRQIAEAHRGVLTLERNPRGRGAVARVRLPLPP
jgi:two-component system nitrogen regulation sensor histidine kinase NtrY